MSNPSSPRFPIPSNFLFQNELPPGFLGPTAIFLDLDTNQLYVCKSFEKQRIGSEEQIRILRERLDQIKSIKSPHIVPYEKVFENDRMLFLIRRYIDTQPITETIPELDHIDVAEWMSTWKNVVRVFLHLHSHGIAPSFIKPNNVFLTKDKSVIITDLYPPPNDMNWMLHAPNPYALGFLAPEYFTQKEPPAAPADMWGLGVLLVLIMTSQLPWNTKNVFTMLHQINSLKMTFASEIPPEVESIIRGLLVIDSKKRLTAEQIINDSCAKPPCVKLPRLESASDVSKGMKLLTGRKRQSGIAVLCMEEAGRLRNHGLATTTRLLSKPDIPVRYRASQPPSGAATGRKSSVKLTTIPL